LNIASPCDEHIRCDNAASRQIRRKRPLHQALGEIFRDADGTFEDTQPFNSENARL
jgi:hypothetical protein